MMTTALYTHPACLGHDTGPGHPERSARLEAVLALLAGPDFAALDRREAPRAALADLLRVHPQSHLDAVFAALAVAEDEDDYVALDADTIVSPGSHEAALRAAGAVVAAVDAVVGGEVGNAFCAIRPPGHHAEPDRAMGFCLFNNIAVGAYHARAVHGLERVAVIDFDVHHGNGTDVLAARDPDLFYASTHEWPLYPGTGRRRQTAMANNIVNVPLDPGTGSDIFRSAYGDEILPALDAFAPSIVLISAGFDAHALDPLAHFQVGEDDFAWVTTEICKRAAILCSGRVVSALEGGYHLEALGRSAAAHTRALITASRMLVS